MSKNLRFLKLKLTWTHRPSVGAHSRLLFAVFPRGARWQEVPGAEVPVKCFLTVTYRCLTFPQAPRFHRLSQAEQLGVCLHMCSPHRHLHLPQ